MRKLRLLQKYCVHRAELAMAHVVLAIVYLAHRGWRP